MSQPRDDRQDDLYGPSLEKIINLRHPLVRLAAEIDWEFLAGRFGSVCRVGPGQPPLPTRLASRRSAALGRGRSSWPVECEKCEVVAAVVQPRKIISLRDTRDQESRKVEMNAIGDPKIGRERQLLVRFVDKI